MDLTYWAATDVGRKRSDNEDNFLIDKDLRLFVVCDGMGGHASGEVASAMAVHTVRDVLYGEKELMAAMRETDPVWHMEICKLLEHSVHTACESIYNKGQMEPEKRGMGTTIVALMLLGNRGYITYVGDSRLYLLRGGIVYQLTEDHSLMNELIRRGKIRAEEFDDSPYANYKNAMTRAVGPHEMVEVDTLDFDLVPGDAFLLCSDGLYEYLDDLDIARTLALPEIKEIPGRLIDMANTRGGKDNITAMVIRIADDGSTDQAAEVNFTLDTLKKIPLFEELSYQQLVRVMNLARIVPMAHGQVLTREGEAGEELFIILRGSVALYVGDEEVARLNQGTHFGEMSLVDSTPRSATAVGAEDGKLLTISRRDFYEVLQKEAPLAAKLLWSFVRELATRLRSTNAELTAARNAQIEEIEEIEEIDEDSMVLEDG